MTFLCIQQEVVTRWTSIETTDYLHSLRKSDRKARQVGGNLRLAHWNTLPSQTPARFSEDAIGHRVKTVSFQATGTWLTRPLKAVRSLMAMRRYGIVRKTHNSEMLMPTAAAAADNSKNSPGRQGHSTSGWDREASLARLADTGVQRKYRTGTILINQGDLGGDVFIVQEGAVRAYAESRTGRTLTLSTYFTGDYVGEMSLDGGHRSASVATIKPTVCSVVSQSSLLAHIRKEPEFAIDMIMRLIQRTRMATQSAKGLALLNVYGRIREFLENMATPDTDGTKVISVQLTHKDIADKVGASREMISKILKDLSVGGYISIERKRIRLLRSLPAGW